MNELDSMGHRLGGLLLLLLNIEYCKRLTAIFTVRVSTTGAAAMNRRLHQMTITPKSKGLKQKRMNLEKIRKFPIRLAKKFCILAK